MDRNTIESNEERQYATLLCAGVAQRQPQPDALLRSIPRPCERSQLYGVLQRSLYFV